ncbi:MAG: energy transducer TonB [Bacteroidota bacterium]
MKTIINLSFIKRASLFTVLFILIFISKSYAQTETDSIGDIVNYCEEMPGPEGGEQLVVDYLQKNLKPQYDENGQKLAGRVILSFVITKTGKIALIENVAPRQPRFAVDERLVKEAIRVVELMPDWRPGKQNGRPINVRYTLPIVFK